MEEQVKDRLKALYTYTGAVENGDSDTISTVLQQASADAVLERMLLEINEVYQKEEDAVVHVDDVAEAQELLLNIFTGAAPDTAAEQAGEKKIGSPIASLSPATSRVPQDEKREEQRVPAKPVGMPVALKQHRHVRSRYRWQIAAVAVILLGLLIAITPGTGALANQILSLFRAQQIKPVNVDVSTPNKLISELYQFMTNFGDVENTQSLRGKPLLTSPASMSPDQLQQALHFKPALPTSLPAEVGHIAQYSISSQEQASFVFNSTKTRSYLASTGQSNNAIPAQLDGATFTLTLEPGLVVAYYDSCQTGSDGQQQCSGGKSFAFTEFPSPVLQSTGSTTLNDLRSFLLSLPKLPETERTILQQVDVHSGTIPVPLPTEIGAQQVNVNGANGLQLNDGKASMLTWQNQGLVYAIAALDVPADQLLATASTLH